MWSKLLLPASMFVVLFFLTGCVNLQLKPSQIVLAGAVTSQGTTVDMRTGDDEGRAGPTFRVPADKVLVITNVLIIPIDLSSANLQLSLIQKGGGINSDRTRQTWFVPATKPRNLDYSPGLIVSSNSSLAIKNDSTQPGQVHVSIHGYLSSKN